MNDIRICYNPNNKHYLSSNSPHNIQLYNKGKQKQFSDYIRGIIINNTLYLRLYYPYNDIDDISKNKLYQDSNILLKDNVNDIIKLIKKHNNINIIDIKYNVCNDLLKGLKLAYV